MPAPIVAAAGIAAGASILQNAFNLIATDKTNEANQRLAEYQNAWNLAQWKRENEYNSPIQQMARYREAGLNPNLIYGSGQASAGNASSLRSADMPQMMAPHVDLNSAVDGAISAFNAVAQNAREEERLQMERQVTASDLAMREVEMKYKTAQMQDILNDPKNRDPLKFSNYYYSGLDDEHDRNQQELLRASYQYEHILPLQRRAAELSNQLQEHKISVAAYEDQMKELTYDLERAYKGQQVEEARWRVAMLKTQNQFLPDTLAHEQAAQYYDTESTKMQWRYNQDTYRARIRGARIGSWLGAAGAAAGAASLLLLHKPAGKAAAGKARYASPRSHQAPLPYKESYF